MCSKVFFTFSSNSFSVPGLMWISLIHLHLSFVQGDKKGLHIKPGTLKLLEDKVGKTLEHIGTRENFLNRTPMASALRPRIEKWDLMRLQSFCKAKDTVKKTKWQPKDWKKILSNPTSDRSLISNIYKELKKLDSWKSNNSIQNGYRAKQKVLNQRISNGWEASKEVLDILSHQGNANQNNFEIPPHTSQNG